MSGALGSFKGQKMDGASSHLPPLRPLKGGCAQGLILDCAGKTAIIPGRKPLGIVVPPDAKVVRLVESQSGHLLLPLDEEFERGKNNFSRKLSFLTSKAEYTFAEVEEPETSVLVTATDAPSLPNSEVEPPKPKVEEEKNVSAP